MYLLGCVSVAQYSTFTYYGAVETDKPLKIFFLGQIGSSQETEAGSVILTQFVSPIHAENFWRKRDAILGPFFCAIWLGQRKSCMRDVICLSAQGCLLVCGGPHRTRE